MDKSDIFKRHLITLHKVTNLAKTVQDRKEDLIKERKLRRESLIHARRNIDANMCPYHSPLSDQAPQKTLLKKDPPTKSTANDYRRRLELLAKWKAEKAKQKQLEQATKKPPFKVYHISPDRVFNLEHVNKLLKGKAMLAAAMKKSRFAPDNHEFRPPNGIKPINFMGSKMFNKVPDTTEPTGSKSQEAGQRKTSIKMPEHIARQNSNDKIEQPIKPTVSRTNNANVERPSTSGSQSSVTSTALSMKKCVQSKPTDQMKTKSRIPTRKFIENNSKDSKKSPKKSAKRIISEKVINSLPKIPEELEDRKKDDINVEKVSDDINGVYKQTSKEAFDIESKQTLFASVNRGIEKPSTSSSKSTAMSTIRKAATLYSSAGKKKPMPAGQKKTEFRKITRKIIENNSKASMKSSKTSAKRKVSEENVHKTAPMYLGPFVTISRGTMNESNDRGMLIPSKLSPIPSQLLKPDLLQTKSEAKFNFLCKRTVSEIGDRFQIPKYTSTPCKSSSEMEFAAPSSQVESMLDSDISTENTTEECRQRAQANNHATMDGGFLPGEEASILMAAQSSWRQDYEIPAAQSFVSFQKTKDSAGEYFQQMLHNISEFLLKAEIPVPLIDSFSTTKDLSATRDESSYRTDHSLSISAIQNRKTARKSTTRLESSEVFGLLASRNAPYATSVSDNEAITDLDKSFANLERLKENDWTEMIPERKAPVQKRKVNAKETNATSALKDMIKAEGKKQKAKNRLVEHKKLFDGGWFEIRIPLKEQVENLEIRFANLDRLKENDWTEMIPERKAPVKKRKVNAKETNATSTLKDIIKVARNKQKTKNLRVEDEEVFDGGWFEIRTSLKKQTWIWRCMLRILWTAHITIFSMTGDTSTKMVVLHRLLLYSYFFGYINPRELMERLIMQGKPEGCRRRGRSPIRWVNVTRSP